MKAILTLILLATFAHASNVFIFEPASSPVLGRGVVYLTSVHTADFQGLPNALINPVMPAAWSNGLSVQWLRTNGGGTVVAMNTSESNSIVTAQLAALAAQKAFEEGMAKTNAINGLALMSLEARLIRAVAVVTMNEINILRTNPTATLSARTLTQMTNAIRNELQAQPDTQ
jgi:hypothetical protein